MSKNTNKTRPFILQFKKNSKSKRWYRHSSYKTMKSAEDAQKEYQKKIKNIPFLIDRVFRIIEKR